MIDAFHSIGQTPINSDAHRAARARLRSALVECLHESRSEIAVSAMRVPLSAPSYDVDDILAAVGTLLDGWPTLGPVVTELEGYLERYLGVRNAIMVSSGGAANLLTLLYASSPFAQARHSLKPGDEVIVSSVAWSTTVTPLLACGCIPVFADASPDGLNIDVSMLEGLISPRTKAIMVVHCLGVACDLDALCTFCERHGLMLIEDACEALGTRWRDQHVGGFGEFGTFSFYFSHHICAVEGGLITTSDDEAAAVLRSMRANGYAPNHVGYTGSGFRAAEQREPGSWMAHFPIAGFNFKPTSLTAALLTGQFARLESYIATRNHIAEAYRAGLADLHEWLEVPTAVDPRCRPSWMALPILVRAGAPFNRAELCAYLQRCAIDTRPIIGGNIADQPFMNAYTHRSAPLPRATQIHEQGLMVGVHHEVRDSDVDHVAMSARAFVSESLERTIRRVRS